ncbi:hypothetical protein KK062_27130 [Fulvivirgaceae bacterium PWU5]|uniref:Uncharacterized protein n=1 Tax=Dawidia cretensis TaxID=2782350 RepID=A0AAP2E2T6_9BACT|nr:hypothetical protein [Dawidia cretensis]MBT1711946.1 hypothetical protein [Dawidia cretensis]
MNKKHFFILLCCASGMLLTLAGLYAISPLTKGIYRGGFDRTFKNQSSVNEKVIELPYNSYYIAGVSNHNIYLGNWTNHFHMIVLNTETLDSQHVTLRIKNKDTFKDIDRFKLKVDSPYFYLTHGTMPALYRGDLNKREAIRFMNDSAFFSDAEPIGKSSFILKTYSTKNKSLELAKETSTSLGIKYNYDILEKVNDGIFCVEGMLHSNKSKNEIVYVYTYRNQYIVMDTSLNLKYRSNTIDTFRHPRIKVLNTESSQSQMLTGIPTIVNSLSSVDDDHLYIKSNILAKNENAKSFVEGATLDVYNTSNGKYEYSMNLYNHENLPLSEFRVKRKKLITIYSKYLILRDLN